MDLLNKTMPVPNNYGVKCNENVETRKKLL